MQESSIIPDLVAKLQQFGELPIGMSDDQASQFLSTYPLPLLLEYVHSVAKYLLHGHM